MELTFQDVAQMTSAARAGSDADGVVTSVCTDSRKVGAGDCFVALSGESFDGHDFVGQAVAQGAASLIVSRPFPEHAGMAQFIVPDTLTALGDLARSWRERFPALPVAALVGSSGKTTTKEMSADIVGASRKLLSTQGNLNNLIGLPATLFRLDAEHEAAILELGMNVPDEARKLVEIAKPGLVALTNIRDAHIGMFGSQEALYHGETESLRFAPAGCDFLMNADDPLSMRARRECAAGHRVLLFGSAAAIGGDSPDIWTSSVEPTAPYGYSFQLWEKGRPQGIRTELKVFGRHNVANAAAACAIARWFGVGLEDVAERLSAFRPRLNRSEVEEIHGWWLLKDFYNAIPSAVQSALDSLKDFQIAGRRLAVLADMMELGEFERDGHVQIGRAAAAAGLNKLYTIGERARTIYETARAEGLEAEHYRTLEELAERLADDVRPGDLLLIKGSRAMKLERLYSLLTGQESVAH